MLSSKFTKPLCCLSDLTSIISYFIFRSSLGVNPFQQYRSSVLISGVDTPDCDRTLQVCTALPSPLQQPLSRPAVEPQGEAEADFSMLKTRFKLLAVTEQETNTAELSKYSNH